MGLGKCQNIYFFHFKERTERYLDGFQVLTHRGDESIYPQFIFNPCNHNYRYSESLPIQSVTTRCYIFQKESLFYKLLLVFFFATKQQSSFETYYTSQLINFSQYNGFISFSAKRTISVLISKLVFMGKSIVSCIILFWIIFLFLIYGNQNYYKKLERIWLLNLVQLNAYMFLNLSLLLVNPVTLFLVALCRLIVHRCLFETIRVQFLYLLINR